MSSAIFLIDATTFNTACETPVDDRPPSWERPEVEHRKTASALPRFHYPSPQQSLQVATSTNGSYDEQSALASVEGSSLADALATFKSSDTEWYDEPFSPRTASTSPEDTTTDHKADSTRGDATQTQTSQFEDFGRHYTTDKYSAPPRSQSSSRTPLSHIGSGWTGSISAESLAQKYPWGSNDVSASLQVDTTYDGAIPQHSTNQQSTVATAAVGRGSSHINLSNLDTFLRPGARHETP